MFVSEIFESFHGECNGHHQGRLVTFIRLSGCNLKCPYCFGVVPGRRIPRLITSRIPNLKLPEVYKGLKLMTFDSTMNLVETEVTEVTTREVRQWYRITIEGIQYFVTPEHPFFTNKGLINAEDLRIGDEILHASFKDKLSLEAKEKFKNRLKSTGRNGMTVNAIKFFDIDKIAPSIRPNPLKVYSISCSPHNTYLLDYMWLHNCDTAKTQNQLNGTDMSPEMILKEVKKLGHNYICLTGGEPLLNKIKVLALLHLLWQENYHISVETNGTIDISPFFRYVESFIIDYKMHLVPLVSSNINRIESNYQKLRSTDIIKFVVKNKEEAEQAFFVKEKLDNNANNAVFSFSPIMPEFPAKELSDYIIKKKVRNAVLSLQIHKLVGFV